MSQTSHRVAIVVAVIGVIGTIGAALIGNWDKIFQRPPIFDGPRPPELGEKPGETIVRDLSSSESVSSARAPLLHVPAEVTGQEISSSGVEGLHNSGVNGNGITEIRILHSS